MKPNDEMMIESRILSLSEYLTETQIADKIEHEFGFKVTVQYVFKVINKN
jgi:hypothetical protein